MAIKLSKEEKVRITLGCMDQNKKYGFPKDKSRKKKSRSNTK